MFAPRAKALKIQLFLSCYSRRYREPAATLVVKIGRTRYAGGLLQESVFESSAVESRHLLARQTLRVGQERVASTAMSYRGDFALPVEKESVRKGLKVPNSY